MWTALHSVMAEIGVAGFAALWALKAAASWAIFRVWKARRGGSGLGP